MNIIVEKDSATKIPLTVGTLEDAQSYAGRGFHVTVEQEDGTFVPLADFLAAQEPETEQKPATKKAKGK